MQINVSGRRINVGDALKAHINERFEGIVEKYFSRSIEAHVTVSKKGPFFHVDCSLHVRQGIHMQSHGEADEAHAAFELAADKLEKQLRRHKRRLKDRHITGRAVQEEEAALMAQAYVLQPEETDSLAEEAGDDSGQANGKSAEFADDQPVIVAETRMEIPHVSVGDAVMLMDLSEQPALMFRNSRNGQFNVVYRRSDGNIGWVDPAELKR
ncbi:ribosomal subunit interface protein [Iodidimonas muriae]|uniref:Ribosome hibernation promoting factor n=1 Tax=Iodidimonas muriae TaxID=261467 RepID=A0ABQ2LCX0_9PROT|nr:ribosome-associated translation inhibitor RaiA [Iodidimonas muriae]GER06711.1 ribosomal subunit interface protein [Kordiimonadales bacterium JCM 17843]GGO10270.1 ribosomal subunit interface protein [Iodidimonas muriae]